jgi:hypothetical protein
MTLTRNNSACTPVPSATCTATPTAVKTTARGGEFNAVCVDKIDHGRRDTPWGIKPQVSLVFEGKDESGNPKFLTRTYNNFPYSRSALTLEIKNWLGRDISGKDEGWDLEECVGLQARLLTFETVSGDGCRYEKIESVNPCGDVHMQPSGTYKRKGAN